MKNLIRLGAKARRKLCRAAALLLIAVMLAGAAPQAQLAAEAAQTKQRTIGIVFDNSGSMYSRGALEWCRAIYAMEVFASMANDGDVIVVYPMWEIEVNGETYTSSDPLEILIGADDPSIIRDIYTPDALGTPIETIDNAYNDLMNRGGEEKWLIVLTDGTYFHMNNARLSPEDTEEELTEKLSDYNNDMNVLYMGIGSGAVEPEILGNSGYVSEVEIVDDSEEVLETLTDMCNTIYGRDSIEDVSDKKVTFDVSMSKLILFVQGKNISGLKLCDSDGNEVEMSTEPYTPHYSEKFCGNGEAGEEGYETKGIDETLSGTIATFADLDAGTYTFTYSGDVTSVAVYYEPDVTLTAYLTDEDGNEVDSSEPLGSGTYYLNYALVDKYGDETTSDLLGDREYTVTYTLDGNAETVTDDDNGRVKMELTEDIDISATVTAKYLDNYVLSVSSEDGSLSMQGHVEADPVYNLELFVSGGESSYPVRELEDLAVYTVTVSYNGEKLTGDALASVDLTASLEDAASTAPVAGCEMSADETYYTVSLKYPSGGANALEAKDYTLKVDATYVEEKGREVAADTATKDFTVEAYDYGLAATMDVSDYYSVYDMNSDEGQSVTVSVTRDGTALTAEEMAQTELEFSAGGIPCTVEKDAENSCFYVNLLGESEDGDEIETGDYTFTATVSSVDELGNQVSATVSGDTSVGLLPKWMITLFWILALLLLALLIWLFFNMKILPKSIVVDADGSRYSVDGIGYSPIQPRGYVGGKLGGRKKSSIRFQAPPDPNHPNLSCSMSIKMQALNPRRKKSHRRKAKVISVNYNMPNRPESLEIGNATYMNVNGVLCLDGDTDKPIKNIKDHHVVIQNSSEFHAMSQAVMAPSPKPGVDFLVVMTFQDR